MNYRFSRASGGAFAALFAMTALTPAYAAEAPTPPAAATTPEVAGSNADAPPSDDIVVTARYKNETLQTVPIAITALTHATLASLRADLRAVLPRPRVVSAAGIIMPALALNISR